MSQDQNPFRGLIKCLNCGKNYRRKIERKVPVYCCSGYMNYGRDFCKYTPIKEEDLIYTINKHISLHNKKTSVNYSDLIQIIEVKDNGYRIVYKDGLESRVNWLEGDFGSVVKY